MTPPQISLCMIVRDEAEMLPRFLAAAAGLWDELIVVDTGSTDDTVALVTAAGAHVLRHTWTNDFAAARNVGLDAAHGQWILFLDADEMASPGLATQLRVAAADDAVGAATVQMVNLLPDGNRRVTPLLRFFRADPEAFFRHRIHEEIATSVDAALRRSGRRMAALPAEVLHLGYTRARAESRDKKTRDLALLEACVAEDASDFYSWFKILELARFWGDPALAHATARACLRNLVRGGPSALANAPWGGELMALAAPALSPDDPAAAARLMDTWAPCLLPAAAFFLRRAELAEQLGDAHRAAREFERCLRLGDVTADRQLVTVRPLMGLARLAIAAGNLDAAWRLTERALGHNPTDPEALTAAVAVCRLVGGDRMLAELTAAYKDRYGDVSPLARVIAG